jgi:putative membrane protein
MASEFCSDCAIPGDTAPSPKKKAANAAPDVLFVTGSFYTEQNGDGVITTACAQLAQASGNEAPGNEMPGNADPSRPLIRTAFVERDAGMWRPLLWLLIALAALPAAPSVPARAADLPTPAFVAFAAAVTKFQIASSQLALRKTQSEVVHRLAHQMILDYSAAGMKFRQALAEARLPSPRDALDAEHKALFDTLSRTAPGKTLSKAYLEAEHKALRDDLAAFEVYAQNGDNDRMRYFAQEMVPVLREHLAQLEKLRP